MKRFAIAMTVIYGILAIIFFADSVSDVNGIRIANIPDTIFCAACLVLCAVHLLGAVILSNQEEIEDKVSDLHMLLVSESKLQKSAAKKDKQRVEPTFTQAMDTEARETVRSSEKTSGNPEWIDLKSGFVQCPRCGKRLSIDYLDVRKKCPDCECVYKS